jgi:signal transduction histidine kinase
MGVSLVAALSELAARVQKGRTQDEVLRIAGQGVAVLGMRFVAFSVDGSDLVLRWLATAPRRLAAIESMIGRSVRGLRAPIDVCAPAAELLSRRENIYREDLDLFDRFLRASTGLDPAVLEARPSTASICNGILAPITVKDEPWGILCVYSHSFRQADADAVALFAMQVGSALDVAGYIEALERAKTELAHRERLAALGELAAIIAHEVRNPLGAMFASVAGLKRLVEHPDACTLVGVIDEETRRLDSIVSDLLEFARPATLRMAHGSLGQVVSEVASSVAARPEASVVEMKVDVDSELPAIPMDRRLMHQAVMNLVLNGLQAMPRGGTLIVRARREERGRDRLACVDVIDTGHGIDEAARTRVFEPFFTTKAAGTGLGLPLVKRVVDAHGGELSFVSSSAGTTFTVGMPIS